MGGHSSPNIPGHSNSSPSFIHTVLIPLPILYVAGMFTCPKCIPLHIFTLKLICQVAA